MPDQEKAALAGAARYSPDFHTNYTSERWTRVTPRSPCPVCRHGGWCRVSPDRKIVACMRVQPGAFKTTMTRAGENYLHRISEEDASSIASAAAIRRIDPAAVLAPPEHRHTVYSAFLDGLTLSERHAIELRERRGLSEEAVVKNLYASVPSAGELALHVARVAGQFTLSGVPGFFRNERDDWRWWSEASLGELLIPVRDRQGRISAILRGTGGKPKYLWMSNGTRGPSCSTPLHFARPYLAELYPDDPVIITESPLKADIITERLHVTVIGVAGVGSIAPLDEPGILQWLARRRVLVAYDADAEHKPKVRRARALLIEKLIAAGVRPDGVEWPESLGKGLDDLLTEGAA